MSKRKILSRMLGVATLAMMFGSASVYAQSSTAPDASGKTPANKAGAMSPSGENSTSSVAPPPASSSDTSGTSGTSGSSSSMGDAAANKENAAGKTPANEAGKMSPTGENSTSSVAPASSSDTSGASGTSGSSASGSSSSMGGAAANKENAAGQTPANEAGKMSPTGQNETSSVKPSASGASGTAGSSASGAATSGSVSKSDQKMMKDLAQANMAEIEAAKVAQQKSSSEEVKTFAQKMIDDHTKASDQLQQLAQAKNVTLPTDLDSKHKSEIKKLSALSGDKFDKRYMSQGGVSDHRKTHALLGRIEKNAKDSDLKTLASSLMPTVDEHWQMAKQIRSGKASTATGSSGTKGGSQSSGATSGSSDTSSGSSSSSSPSSASPSSGSSSDSSTGK
jgi:putative membrane protein